MRQTHIALTVAAAALFTTPAASAAQAPAWFIWHNKVAPSVTASVTLDPSGNFRYRYGVANGAGAQQRINLFHLDLAVPAAAAASPTDWFAIVASRSVSWGADGAVDPAWQPAHEMDLPSFLSEIAPGASQAGFDLFSPCAGSNVPLTYFVQGYDHLGVQPEEDTTWTPQPEWRDDAVRGTVLGPGDCSNVADWGNRRPGVDGFLGVVNFVNGATLPPGPATVQIRFSRAGEVVDRASFKAELNSVDVTAQFVPNSRGDLVAVFSPGSSPAQTGRNVLLLSVSGQIAGSTRVATDADRFTFTLP